mmetsp:Transcript_28097/g.70493  ORF Transcript_28097/g.70493 Transcript_28097/m.70493 type:complete len:535 (+) Transcript_28097:24-1628(+)
MRCVSANICTFYADHCSLNVDQLSFGIRQDGEKVDNVVLPPWAQGSAERFVRVNRQALESDYVSSKLHHWIDLVFGVDSHSLEKGNYFYTDNIVVEGVGMRAALEELETPGGLGDVLGNADPDLTVIEFGRTPNQVFNEHHPERFLSPSLTSTESHLSDTTASDPLASPEDTPALDPLGHPEQVPAIAHNEIMIGNSPLRVQTAHPEVLVASHPARPMSVLSMSTFRGAVLTLWSDGTVRMFSQDPDGSLNFWRAYRTRDLSLQCSAMLTHDTAIFSDVVGDLFVYESKNGRVLDVKTSMTVNSSIVCLRSCPWGMEALLSIGTIDCVRWFKSSGEGADVILTVLPFEFETKSHVIDVCCVPGPPDDVNVFILLSNFSVTHVCFSRQHEARVLRTIEGLGSGLNPDENILQSVKKEPNHRVMACDGSFLFFIRSSKTVGVADVRSNSCDDPTVFRFTSAVECLAVGTSSTAASPVASILVGLNGGLIIEVDTDGNILSSTKIAGDPGEICAIEMMEPSLLVATSKDGLLEVVSL